MSKKTIHQANASEYLAGLDERSPTLFLAAAEKVRRHCKDTQVRNALFGLTLARAKDYMAKKEYALAFELLNQAWNDDNYTLKQGVELAELSLEVAVRLANPASWAGASTSKRSYHSEAAVLLDNASSTKGLDYDFKLKLAQTALGLAPMAANAGNVMAARSILHFAYDFENLADPSWGTKVGEAYMQIGHRALKLGGYESLANDCFDRAYGVSDDDSKLEEEASVEQEKTEALIDINAKKSPKLLENINNMIGKLSPSISDFEKGF